MEAITVLTAIVAANFAATIYFARNLGKVEGELKHIPKGEEIRRVVREEISSFLWGGTESPHPEAKSRGK